MTIAPTDPRYKTIPIIRKDGVIVDVRIRRDNLDKYQRQVVNSRGKRAYVKQASQERALEVFRGSGRKMVRVHLTARTDYKPKKDDVDPEDFQDQKKQQALQMEIDAVAVVPEDEVEQVVADWQEWRQEIMDAHYGGIAVDAGEHRVEPAGPNARAGFEFVKGTIKSGGTKTRKSIPERAQTNIAAWLDERLADDEGTAAPKAQPEEVARLLRAVQGRTKKGATFWYDPKTGQRTLDPTIVQELAGDDQ